MSFQVQGQESNRIRLLRWVTSPAGMVNPTLPHNDGLVLPAGRIRYFSESECNEIVRLREHYSSKAAITGDGGQNVSYRNRNTVVATFYSDERTSWIFERLESAIGDLMNHFRFELAGFFEGAQLYVYPTGGFLNAHMDIGKGCLSTRKLGITVQLSDPASYDGGELEFIDSTQTVPRERGTLVIFPTYMLHQVRPVTRGQRLSLVSWIHGPPFR